jgi:hypothetical protein
MLRAIVTTNFDRLLERALQQNGVAHRVYASADAFNVLQQDLAAGAAAFPVIKAHGTADDPATMVDTLAQRVAGRPKALEDAITELLRSHACVVLGFSGADLAYDPDYLGLRAAAAEGAGFTTLVLPETKPQAPMRNLLNAWGNRGAAIEGSLPDWLIGFASELGVNVPSPAADEEPVPWKERLAEHTAAWVDSLGTVSAVNMFTSLIDANSDDDSMLRYLMFYRRYYRSTEDALLAQYPRFEYNLGRRLLDRGLIGTIEPKEAGLVPEWQADVEARAYVDGFQFLTRGAKEGKLPEGEADVVRLLALKMGHGHVRGNVSELTARYLSERPERANYEIALLAAEFAEEFGETDNGELYCRLAFAVAHEMGDEPRRGAALARAARLLGLRKDYDTASRLAEDALGIATRLALPVLEADALAARGMVDVLRSHDAGAVGPLMQACATFRRMQRRPRLTYALCDLARAAYYSGRPDLASDALEESMLLARKLPGLLVQALLARIEILEHAKQYPEAVAAARELIEVGTELQHATGVARAKRALTRMGGE